MSMYGPVQVKNEETGEKEILMEDINVVRLNQSDYVDTQLIQEVKQGKNGVSIKLADKQKAIEWLSKYFLMHPGDKLKAEFDRKKAGVDDTEYETDGFLEALREGTAEMFEKAGDAIET